MEETDQDIEPITENDLLVFGAYGRIAYSLKHSNRVQLTYKLTTFTWFIATFIGAGYLISSREVSLPFAPLLMVPTVCMFSLFIIAIIWYLDLIVEEKRIASAVYRGLKAEEKHEILPGAYHNVVALQPFAGYISLKTLFYLGLASILVLTMTASIAANLYLEKYRYWHLAFILPFFFIPFIFLLSKYIEKKKNPYEILRELDR